MNYSTYIRMSQLQCNSTTNSSEGWIREGEYATYTIIIPSLLIVGFLCQLLNLLTLHGSRIRSLSYTLYFKSLSINYLLGIPFFVPSLLQKHGMIDRSQMWQVFYFAHINQYAINMFLFGGNMIILALAAEPLRAILRPMDSLRWSPTHAVHVLLVLYAVTAISLLPVIFQFNVVQDADGLYCYMKQTLDTQKIVRYVIAPTFELGILVGIVIIYICLLVSYYGVRERHRQLTSTVRSVNKGLSQRNLSESNSKKAIVICIASITAYIISNLPSAVKEFVYLWKEMKLSPISWTETSAWRLFQFATNICLLSNFWLIVLLQYAISSQYRTQVQRLLCRRQALSNYTTHTYCSNSSKPLRHNSPGSTRL